MSQISERQLLAVAERLPSLGQAVNGIIASIEKPTINLENLAQEIGRDPVITARVLRVANAAFFGYSGRIGSIIEAVVILGLDTVRSIAISASFMKWVRQACGEGGDLMGLWKHAIGGAVASRVLAGSVGINRETAFVCGLLHNIGRLLLVSQFSTEYKAVLRQVSALQSSNSDKLLSDIEEEVLGLGNEMAGYLLLRHWHLPVAIQEAVRHHLHPVEPVDRLTALTHLGHVLAQALDFGACGDGRVDRLSKPSLDALGLDVDMLGACFGVIESQYEQLAPPMMV